MCACVCQFFFVLFVHSFVLMCAHMLCYDVWYFVMATWFDAFFFISLIPHHLHVRVEIAFNLKWHRISNEEWALLIFAHQSKHLLLYNLFISRRHFCFSPWTSFSPRSIAWWTLMRLSKRDSKCHFKLLFLARSARFSFLFLKLFNFNFGQKKARRRKIKCMCKCDIWKWSYHSRARRA